MVSRMHMLAFSALVALAVPCFLSGGCARRALAEEVVVQDDYATDSDVQGLSSEVSGLSGSVNALTGTVSDDLRDLSDDVAVMGSQLDGLVDSQTKQDEVLDEVLSDADSIQDRLGAVNSGLSAQDEQLDSISEQVVKNGDAIKALSDTKGSSEVEALELEDLLLLVPEGASDEIVGYIQHPFLWGMAAGIVGWVISLIIGAVYRLLGFR